MFNKKWIKLIGITVSFPSLLLASGLAIKVLVTEGIITKAQGVIILVVLAAQTMALIVYYAYKQKN